MMTEKLEMLRQWVLDRESADVDVVVADLTTLIANAVDEARKRDIPENAHSYTVRIKKERQCVWRSTVDGDTKQPQFYYNQEEATAFGMCRALDICIRSVALEQICSTNGITVTIRVEHDDD